MPFGLLSNRGICIRYPRAFGVNHQLVQSLFSNKSFSGCESGSAATKSMASSCSVVAAPADLMVDTSVSNCGLIKPSGVFFGDRMRRRVQLSLRSYHGGRPYLVYNYEQSRNKSALFSSNGLAAGYASCYSDGIVPKVSTDGSLSVEQLTTAPLSATQNPSHSSRKLLSGACYLPHPAKEETGGEDAHFICADEQVIGVADGVGGWADVGVNAGEFSRELMHNSVKAIREVPHGDIDLLQVLEKAHKTATAMGSSTACIVALKNQDLHAINLGDSGFIVVRDGSTIFESPVQQHGFNFTYQLEKGNRADLPSSGQVFKISVVAGDVVVAGTDGLFDNLSSEEVAAVVGDAVKEGLSPDAAAEKIAAFARVRALDRKHPSPFSKAAQQAGFIYYGDSTALTSEPDISALLNCYLLMSFHARHQNIVSSSSSSPWLPVKPKRAYFLNGKIFDLNNPIINPCYTRKKCRVRISRLGIGEFHLRSDLQRQSIIFCKLRSLERLLPMASTDDGVTLNGSRTNTDVEDMRYKLNQSLQDEDYNTGLVQLLHDAARVFELAIKEQSSSSKISWFSTAWLGVDKTAWAKTLAYQASVYSLLQAAIEISSRGDGRDRDINVFVHRSLSKQRAPLESVIRDKMLAKQPKAYDWFWSEQIPVAVTSFVDYFEKEQRFSPANAVYRKGLSSVSGNSSDVSRLLLALSCIAAIMKLGPTKVSCAQFFSIIPEVTGRLMDMLVEFVHVRQAYHSITEIGLCREFLVHFGARAAACRIKNELGAEEIVFWVGLVQKQLQRAIDRERIWSTLTTSESIEVLERDLAIFGFFIALGRSTQCFLFANGFENMNGPIEGFIRYLIGGSVLYYPQLSAISSYQLYVEVVCEELDWLPFYPGSSSNSKRTFGHKHKEGPPNTKAIPLVLDVCSHWIESFIKYSKWLENPSNVKAARFLSKGHDKLKVCMEELGMQKEHSPVDKESQSFDKALESVEEALLRLEELLQELHVSSSSSGKEHLKAACTDLERMRRLKKEAEFLEASFRAKASSIQRGNASGSRTSIAEQQQYSGDEVEESSAMITDDRSRSHGLWSFLIPRSKKSSGWSSSTADDGQSDGLYDQETASKEMTDSESNEIQRFEILRNELMELEKRVQRSADRCGYEEEEIPVEDAASTYAIDAKGNSLIQVQKKDSIIGKSLDKLKETSTDVLQGTQLLAIDTGAALGLIRRVLIGDELTEKEKQALKRTLTDLASVVPIGVLMLLPVTAVGHAAMLAAIQHYVPSLIPSTYGPERLELLRQLEKVKEMEGEVSLNENVEE